MKNHLCSSLYGNPNLSISFQDPHHTSEINDKSIRLIVITDSSLSFHCFRWPNSYFPSYSFTFPFFTLLWKSKNGVLSREKSAWWNYAYNLLANSTDSLQLLSLKHPMINLQHTMLAIIIFHYMRKITFRGRNLAKEKTIFNFLLYLYLTSYTEKRERSTPIVKTPHTEILHLVIFLDVITSLPLYALGLLIWIFWITMLAKAILWSMQKMALKGRTLHRRRQFLIFRLLLRFAFSALTTLLLASENV